MAGKAQASKRKRNRCPACRQMFDPKSFARHVCKMTARGG